MCYDELKLSVSYVIDSQNGSNRNQKNLKAAAKVKNHECGAQPMGEQAQVRAATLHQGETGRKRTDPGSPKITPGDAKQTSEGA